MFELFICLHISFLCYFSVEELFQPFDRAIFMIPSVPADDDDSKLQGGKQLWKGLSTSYQCYSQNQMMLLKVDGEHNITK